ncbi:aldehyde dehydrogenase family protein, partial [Salmonella enterica]|uniref:aldehyde dehydrogenase family protein n=1 Tax=Salmonella enterica TaxID=28901 RepID=UPI003D2DBC0B
DTAEELRRRLVEGIAKLRVGVSTDRDADFGPVVTAQHKARILSYIDLGVEEGAELVVDGRDFTMQGHENGFFVGPTLFDRVTP